MDIQTVIQKTYDLLESGLKIERTKITPNAKLIDLTADSIQLFELVLLFEKEFALETSYEDIIRIETVQDIIDYLLSQESMKAIRRQQLAEFPLEEGV